jgi:hypothetical protein
MLITLTNVKSTVINENINLDNTDDLNALNNQIFSVFPDCENWSYDQINDKLYIFRPTPPIADTFTIGEVSDVDYSVG